jgi:hypothetical protein
MGTKIDAIQEHPLCCKQSAEPLMNAIELPLVKEPSTNGRLIGYYYQTKAHAAQLAQPACRPG